MKYLYKYLVTEMRMGEFFKHSMLGSQYCK